MKYSKIILNLLDKTETGDRFQFFLKFRDDVNILDENAEVSGFLENSMKDSMFSHGEQQNTLKRSISGAVPVPENSQSLRQPRHCR